MKSQVTSLFQATFNTLPDIVASAPGRIEFIGNHTDYNGGQVLGAAVDRFVVVAVKKTSGNLLRFISDGRHQVTVSTTDIQPLKGTDSWVNYPLGVLESLKTEGLSLDGGFDMAVISDLPHGAGMSSSAAIELATAYALTNLYGPSLDKKTLAKVCRRAENEFVGVPCGILDQGVSAFGKRNHLVRINCREETFETVELPKDVHFWIFNSEKKHSLVESLYETRHAECMSALKKLQQYYPDAQDLCSLTPDQVKAHHDKLSEEEFARALHVTAENERVKHTVQALGNNDLDACGQLLFGSHFSSKTLFKNSIPELDYLVDLLRENESVYGARLTGGGFGGAVMALTNNEFSETDAAEISARYAEKFNLMPSVFHTETGDGARLL